MLNLALRLCQAVVLMPSHFPRFGQSLGLIEWHWRQMVFVYVSLTAAQQSCLLDPDLQVQSCFCHIPLRLCREITIRTAERLQCNTQVLQKLSLSFWKLWGHRPFTHAMSCFLGKLGCAGLMCRAACGQSTLLNNATASSPSILLSPRHGVSSWQP